LQYWIISSLFSYGTEFLDTIADHVPFVAEHWYEIEFFVTLWFVLPWTDGSCLLYDQVSSTTQESYPQDWIESTLIYRCITSHLIRNAGHSALLGTHLPKTQGVDGWENTNALGYRQFMVLVGPLDYIHDTPRRSAAVRHGRCWDSLPRDCLDCLHHKQLEFQARSRGNVLVDLLVLLLDPFHYYGLPGEIYWFDPWILLHLLVCDSVLVS
jgi:TB2/DP1, HVA22 family